MKTHNHVLAIALLALTTGVGCGGKKASKPKTPVVKKDTPTTTTTEEAKPPANITSDQMVSPSVGVSADLAQACSIAVPSQQPDLNPNFDYDKEDLMAEDRAVLEKIATCLTSGPLKGRSVQLVGRADPRGTDEYNLGLGSKRANSVSQYLGRLGVPNPQIGQTTRGAIDATGTNEDGWRKDRRVDILLNPSS